MFCAADEYQDLDPQGTCEGVDWARAAGQVVCLRTVHRTNVAALLTAARSVRASAPPVPGPGFKIFAAANANVAASFLAKNLTWAHPAQVAVISPAGPNKSPFVRDTLKRLGEKPFIGKDKKTFGPFSIPWEATTTDQEKGWTALLALDDPTRVLTSAEILSHEAELPSPLIDWVRTRGRLAGEVSFPALVLREQLGRAQSLIKAYGSPRRLARLGLTVHQAKNREFDQVIVLWPVTLVGDVEVQRRLLYNAITRARRDCLVIVQDPFPGSSRLAKAPFV